MSLSFPSSLNPPFLRQSGLQVDSYRHYDPSTCGFDAAGCYEDLKVGLKNKFHYSLLVCLLFYYCLVVVCLQRIPDKSMVLFHACAHNPTGADLTVSKRYTEYIYETLALLRVKQLALELLLW